MTGEKGEIKDLAEGCGKTCRWFLVGITDGKMTHTDGCWSNEEEVGQALYLRNQLALVPHPDEWVSVYIGMVEPIPYEVDQESIRICNKILDRSLRGV